MLRRIFLLAAIASPAFAADPCCGVITPAGERLAKILDGMDVAHLWQAHLHVDWETGQSDRNADYEGPGKATHCSAFAAAAGKRLGVYMLRPPEHGQILLASAQTRWFASPAAQAGGWRPIDGMRAAQSLANQGQLVVISYESPDRKKPGHIVIVRPSLKTAEQFALEGPQVIEAATQNRQSWPAAKSFTSHPGAWPAGVRVFAHDIPATS